MSNWKKAHPEDLEIDGDELNVLIGTNEQRNNYMIIKLSDIRKLTKELNKI